MKIITAPGPVSYPLILATGEHKDLDLAFGKGGEEHNAYAITDSLTSLIRSGLRIDIVTVKKLMFVYPELRGPRIAVWRRGSAADVLTRALLDRGGLRAELIYADDWPSVLNMLNTGNAQSAVLNLGILEHDGEFLEDLVNAPGACGAQINGDPQYFIDVYNTGIRIARENPVDSADYVVSKLPIKLPRDFVLNILRRVDYGIYSPGDISGFIRLVRSYVDKP
ncbi:hypothetical protein VMUT_0824 [Vulcanisaeta moutnovskia 768-28]|uniref:DUF3834 domain-containing protein n=1 Tax=Vulcanisaeta moutnovskia (strain 768-28) TaxID=985053 RepID=F0QWI6_VULM7|nr:DUF3834 domain-containing protein [Vulcanisaeta moutnovskia]ADY01034.1 hypothetical protein VMUT_0824 [Vulcanisaeta moutnovskia 768-28]